MDDTNIVPEGTRVRYHGSLKHYHGEATVVGTHEERVPTYGEFSPVRYYLLFDPLRDGDPLPGDYLHNVRPESFTPVTDE